MSPDFSNLTAQPDLRQWILSGKWKSAFDHNSLARSAAYASARMIRHLEVGRDPAGHSVVVSAAIHGTAPKPYQTEVIFEQVNGQWRIDPDCSCPVGYHCKHAAALIHYIATELAKEHVIATPQLTPELRDWLNSIETAARAGSQAVINPVAKPENRFLAYCIEPPHYGDGSRLKLILRVGTRQKDGSIRISETQANADPSKPPKYMTPADLLVAAI